MSKLSSIQCKIQGAFGGLWIPPRTSHTQLTLHPTGGLCLALHSGTNRPWSTMDSTIIGVGRRQRHQMTQALAFYPLTRGIEILDVLQRGIIRRHTNQA